MKKMSNKTVIKIGLLVFASMVFNFQFSICSSVQAQDSVLTVDLPGGQHIEMVWIEGGTFTMGSNNAPEGVSHSYDASRPEHQVSVGGFYLCRYEVTQGVWVAVMGENPAKFTPATGHSGDLLPVESVSWSDAQQFVAMLSQQTGMRFRLPTEAEWEYAARGGQKSQRLPYAGTGRGRLEHYGWFCVNSERCTHPVGTLLPNELGLYDMSGNVAEWCSDWMESYSEGEQTNPRGPREGESRVLRGGHYNSVSAACTVYDRSWYVPSGKSEYFGLRLAMDPAEE